ncbi:unnamed protein product, partial [Rotaria socialis]
NTMFLNSSPSFVENTADQSDSIQLNTPSSSIIILSSTSTAGSSSNIVKFTTERITR